MSDSNKERELFEASGICLKETFNNVGWDNWQNKYVPLIREKKICDNAIRINDRFLGWRAAKAQALPKGYTLVTEDQAKDTARLDFMLQENKVITTDINVDENYERTGEGFCVNAVYWIDGWDRLTETVHQTKREAIDEAMNVASESEKTP